MLKVLIVDDEALIREELRELLDWKSEQMIIVGEAANGKIGLQMSVELNPDITLLDVKMPVMDGLAFLEEMNKSGIKSKVIILSSYEDFSYAQRAIKLGACNYLLKHTLESDTLMDAVRKAKNEIDNERAVEVKVKTLEERLSKVLPIGKQAFFKDLIDGRINFNEKGIEREFVNLGINLKTGSYHVIVFFIDDCFNVLCKGDTKEKNSIMFNVVNEMQGVMRKYGNGEVFAVDTGTYCLIMDRVTVVSEYRTERSLQEIASSVYSNIRDHVGISVSSVIVERVKDINELANCYEKAVETIKIRIFNGYGRSYFLNERNYVSREYDISYFNKFTEQIRNALDTSDMDRIGKSLKALLIDELRFSYNHEAVNQVLGELVKLYNKFIESRNIENVKVMELSDVILMDSIERIYNFFNEKLVELVKISMVMDEYNSGVIKRAVSYIKKNYNRDINLNTVANHVNVNRIYLSLLFKKEVGENFSDFVTRIRIERAKELLEGSGKLYEVACEVGFNDPKYFSVVFKKITGMSPLDFRKLKSQ